MTGALGISTGVSPGTKFNVYSNAPSGASPLTTPLVKIHADDSTYDQWVVDIENDGVMTSLEINDYAQKNFHENGLSVTSIVAQDASILQQGYVNFRLQDAASTAHLLELNNFSTGDALLVEQNNDGVAIHSLKDYINGNHNTTASLFIDDYVRVSDGGTYSKSSAAAFIRSRAQRTSGTITNTGKVLDVRQEDTLATGETAYIRNDGTGHALSVDNNSTGRALFLDHSGVNEMLYMIRSGALANNKAGIYYDLQSAMANSGNKGIWFYTNGAHAGSTPFIEFRNDNASAANNTLNLLHDSTGKTLFIDNNNTGRSIDIDHDANSASVINGIYVDLVNAGAGAANAINVVAGLVNLNDAVNLVIGTTTGTKIGTAITQKLGFYGSTPVVQATGVADADGTLADITTKFNSLLAKMEAYGLLAVA
jgi:hypothetical protein